LEPNIEALSHTKVDFSNTLEAPGYVLLGLGAGYNINDDINVYVDGRNLLDKEHIATFSTIVDTSANTSVFYPGDGRRVFAGVKVQF
jgi:iron complex outermembrane receptor protein